MEPMIGIDKEGAARRRAGAKRRQPPPREHCDRRMPIREARRNRPGGVKNFFESRTGGVSVRCSRKKAQKMEPMIGIDKEGAARRRAGAKRRQPPPREHCDRRMPIREARRNRPGGVKNFFESRTGGVSVRCSRKKAQKMEPMIGIEPMTYSLRVNCSTD